jgi:long-chain acyl-CoA synthetase
MFDYFMGVARKVGEKILNGEQVPFGTVSFTTSAKFCVYGPLKNRMGLTRLKVGLHGGRSDRSGDLPLLPVARV